jgi:hypothetical protein
MKKEPSPPLLEDGVVATYGAVAAYFGVSRDCVRRDWVAAGMPRTAEGQFDLRRIAEWRQRRARETGRPQYAPFLSDARLAHVLRVYLAWERVELQALGMPEPEQSRFVVKLLYSAMGLLDAAGLNAGSPQPKLLESLGLAEADAECEAWYWTAEGSRYADAFERLGSGLPCY